MLDISGFLKGETRIGSKTVMDILKYHSINEPHVSCPKNNPENIYLEEVTQYNDVFKSITVDKKTKTFVVKTINNKRLLLCFEPRMDRIQVRTVQQKLSDITTNYVLSHIDDKAFINTFVAFYVPMAAMIKEYAKLRKLNVPSDLAFYYKGGNMFRIILGGIIRLLRNPEYDYLLKRSDADFQIYINPSLPNSAKVREDVTKLVLYVLNSMREHIRRSKTLRVCGSTADLAESYKNEIRNVMQVDKVDVILREAARKDFAVTKSKLLPQDTNEYVLLQEMDSLMEGLPKPQRSTYFISRNTSLDFSRKDKLKATFDLIRFRRNFKVQVNDLEDVNAPFEIIDVSIPKENDYAMMKMQQAGVGPLLKQYAYKFGRSLISFVAPTVSYLWTDLHDLLFKQNEYPWEDIKYTKRMTRYFLTIIVFSIVESVDSGHPVTEKVQSLIVDFRAFEKMLNDNANVCNSSIDTLQILAKEMKTLQSRISAIHDNFQREIEQSHMLAFTKDMARIFGKLSKELEVLTDDTNLQTSYQKVSFGISQTF